MDYISVKDLEIYGYHGVLEAEKQQGQFFYISLDAFFSLLKAGQSDVLEESVSYADMCYTVERVVKKERFDLIEALAERIAHELLTTYPLLESIRVKVKKPHAPIGRPVKYASVTIERAWHKAYISMGSNIGDVKGNLNGAIAALNEMNTVRVTKVSKFIETKPWGVMDQANFLNGAIEIETLLSPQLLMSALLLVEKNLGRERIIHWGPRTLDLDIIFYDDLISNDPIVILPHPRMEQRMFVLEPLCEIAPYMLHPVLKKRIFELMNCLAVITNNEVNHEL
jgi:dihydroneopterin aldolase/2-amino-4-hydroxy-6-hydroxymethyldihydropteridine diphosphokinase